MEQETVFIDVRTASREHCEIAMIAERDDILMRVIRLAGEIESLNTNRFDDDPISLDLDFNRQLEGYRAKPLEERVLIFNAIAEALALKETAGEPREEKRIVTLDDVRDNKPSTNGKIILP